VSIERWPADHPRLEELRRLVASQEQTRAFTFSADWHLASHVLVAVQETAVVGFLRFVVQEIGPDNEQPAVRLDGIALTEAKILAFGVPLDARKQGIGRGLQHAAIAWARALDCYQVRSHSDGRRQANHHLKLSLGFAVHPIIRGDDQEGAYFIMPLRANFRGVEDE
jgi:GNAT superfamily N-acetyltransferase